MHDEYMYGYGYVYVYIYVCVCRSVSGLACATANSKLIVPTVLSTAVLLFISAVHPHVCCRSDSCACATVATSVLAVYRLTHLKTHLSKTPSFITPDSHSEPYTLI